MTQMRLREVKQLTPGHMLEKRNYNVNSGYMWAENDG